MLVFERSYTVFLVCISAFQLSRPGWEIGSAIEDAADFGEIIFNGDKLIPHNSPSENNDKTTSTNEGP